MAVTVISNTATELGSKYVGEARLKTISRTFTNTEVKALPATGAVALVADVANTLLIPVWANIIGSFAAGAYTNVAATNASYIGISTNNESGYSLAYNRNSTAEGITHYTDFFTANINLLILGIDAATNLAINGQRAAFNQHSSDYKGQLEFVLNNGASGNLTGGNAANQLKVTVGYLEIVLP